MVCWCRSETERVIVLVVVVTVKNLLWLRMMAMGTRASKGDGEDAYCSKVKGVYMLLLLVCVCVCCISAVVCPPL